MSTVLYLNLEILRIAQNEVAYMYNSTDVADRIRTMAKARGVSVKKLLEDVGLGFNTMSNMKTSMPKADNLAKIADYLDCSVDYLLGRTDSPELIKKAPPIGDAGEEYEIDKDAPPLSAEEIARLRQFLRDSNTDTGK